MSLSTQTFSSDVSITGAANSNIINLSLPTPNTEVSQVLTANVKKLIIRNRSLYDSKLTFVVGESGTKYVTLKAMAVLELNDLTFASATLYAQATGISVLEIWEFY